ncbi:hypothetical protein Tco_0817940 [Tanacetum coccineum]
MTDGASTTIVVRVKASFRQGVNLQSGEVVVGGKRQKVQRRRRREVEHEEDPPSSPPNPQVLLMTRVEPSITRASSQMNDIDNHTSARNAFSINQQESSSYEYQQSMVLKGITPVAVRTSQESHTRVTNIMYNHVPTDAVTATITNYADEMHSTHSNSGKTPPSVQHQLIDQQQIKGRTQMALPRDSKDYYLLDTLKQHLMRPTTAMLPTLHLQQIPNTEKNSEVKETTDGEPAQEVPAHAVNSSDDVSSPSLEIKGCYKGCFAGDSDDVLSSSLEIKGCYKGCFAGDCDDVSSPSLEIKGCDLFIPVSGDEVNSSVSNSGVKDVHQRSLIISTLFWATTSNNQSKLLCLSMAAAAIKHMDSSFAKLEKFEEVDFRRWQKKMHFLRF